MGVSASHDRQGSGSIRREASSTSSPPGDRTSTVPGALIVQDLVAEFHHVYGCATEVPLVSASDELIDLRVDLIQEELGETLAAMRSGDVLAVARELADLAYVTAGTAVAFGLIIRTHRSDTSCSLVADCDAVCASIVLRTLDLTDMLSQLLATIRRHAQLFGVDLDAAVAEVHRANLSKLDDDGQPVMRPDGKILKGSNFSPPDMRSAVHPSEMLICALRDDFTVPIGSNPAPPPWWLDGIQGA